jgi:hypothetical protein
MQEVVETSTEEVTREPARIMVPSPVVKKQEKEVIRRKRYDPTLNLWVEPNERDAIKAYMAKHDGDYPPQVPGSH